MVEIYPQQIISMGEKGYQTHRFPKANQPGPG
jgi:hypothetical protein